MTIAIVVEYGHQFRDGRVIVEEFKSKAEALRYVVTQPDRNLRISSLNPQTFQHSVRHVHDLVDRTCGDATSIEKVEGGLRCCDEFWAFDRSGSGPEGRAMPGDIWLWARIAEHRASCSRRMARNQ